MEIKEGFRNGSNQQPQHLLQSGKTAMSHERQVLGSPLPSAPLTDVERLASPASIVASRPALLCMKYFISYGPHFTASQLSMLS
eukprot:jgi/Tetstr1/462547/TSEL_007535.t1